MSDGSAITARIPQSDSQFESLLSRTIPNEELISERDILGDIPSSIESSVGGLLGELGIGKRDILSDAESAIDGFLQNNPLKRDIFSDAENAIDGFLENNPLKRDVLSENAHEDRLGKRSEMEKIYNIYAMDRLFRRSDNVDEL
ncbi:hypothetical protein DL93DRAFT_2087110, partial [Clavulina sp. PMI_390]